MRSSSRTRSRQRSSHSGSIQFYFECLLFLNWYLNVRIFGKGGDIEFDAADCSIDDEWRYRILETRLAQSRFVYIEKKNHCLLFNFIFKKIKLHSCTCTRSKVKTKTIVDFFIKKKKNTKISDSDLLIVGHVPVVLERVHRIIEQLVTK